MSKIGILGYGTGNLSSLVKSFSEVGESPLVIYTRFELAKVDALVLPGVGHFGTAMRYLDEQNFVDELRAIIRSGMPTLGICLGFQLLCESSDEDVSIRGLGLLPLAVSRIKSKSKSCIKVPQIGWNNITRVVGKPRLLEGLAEEELIFYYANSFGVKSNSLCFNSASYFHGDDFLALVEVDSIFGMQFHPEKSGKQGIHILKNFITIIKGHA